MKEQLQLCSHKQSLRLKELNFDWHTTHYYNPEGAPVDSKFWERENWNAPKSNKSCSAPNIAHALMWIRSKGFTYSLVDNIEMEWQFRLYGEVDYSKKYSTYELAESALLDKLLTLLEKLL